MMQCFFQDVNLIWNSFSAKPPADILEENKVILAAVRVIGSLCIVSGAVKAIYAVPILATTSGLTNLAIGVANCVFGYDVFVMARNMTDMHTATGVATTLISSALNSIRKGSSEAAREKLAQNITKGTILPIWQASYSLWLDPLVKFFLTRRQST